MLACPHCPGASPLVGLITNNQSPKRGGDLQLHFFYLAVILLYITQLTVQMQSETILDYLLVNLRLLGLQNSFLFSSKDQVVWITVLFIH